MKFNPPKLKIIPLQGKKEDRPFKYGEAGKYPQTRPRQFRPREKQFSFHPPGMHRESLQEELSSMQREVQFPYTKQQRKVLDKQLMERMAEPGGALLKKYVLKAQRVMDKKQDKSTTKRELKKIEKEFQKELIKEHPEEEASLKKLYKRTEEFSNIKVRFVELAEIRKSRPLTEKEMRELKDITRRLKKLSF